MWSVEALSAETILLPTCTTAPPLWALDATGTESAVGGLTAESVAVAGRGSSGGAGTCAPAPEEEKEEEERAAEDGMTMSLRCRVFPLLLWKGPPVGLMAAREVPVETES